MAEVYWITGLAGAGKTTMGTQLYDYLRDRQPTVLLDGDALRNVMGNLFGYAPEERRKGAFIVCRLCKLLAEQGITVICCTISMFHDVRQWNRDNISGYREIYLKVSMDTLIKRDQKGLYSQKTQPVMGLTVSFDEPRTPDLVLHNDGDLTPQQQLEIILDYFKLE